MGYFILIINILGESLYSHFFLLTETKCLERNDANYYLIEYDCQEELCKIIDSPLGKQKGLLKELKNKLLFFFQTIPNRKDKRNEKS